MKKTLKVKKMPMIIEPAWIPSLEKGKNGMYSLDESALKSIISYITTRLLRGFHSVYEFNIREALSLILNIREKKKQAEMYQSFIDLIWPGNILHPKFNHARTETGRLSCAEPNVQQA